MKDPKKSLSSKSLQDLKALLEAKSISLPYCRVSIPVQEMKLGPEAERALFQKAMEGVAPISHENCVERISEFRPPERKSEKDEEEAEERETLSRLIRLVKDGRGFEIEDTPEYIEGASGDVPAGTAKNLHRGKYSIQAPLDLHGLNAEDAKDVFEKFLKWAVVTGKRGVLIIHGRGLASPAEPVLKTKVIEWMTHGSWRKWVAAYASARLYDGGAGATYVLLRSRPAAKKTKRQQK